MRGIAAIAVMLFHAGPDAPLAMPRGYLAADLFFVLSGFVLAHSYQDRLRGGMSMTSFIRSRLQRIYPVFWLGALAGCVLLAGSPLTMLMIPNEYGQGLLFRANAPLWSLLFELLVNFAWAALLVRRSAGWLAAATVTTGALFFLSVMTNGSADLGAFWPTALPGLARTAFSFLVGAGLFHLFRKTGRPAQRNQSGWLLLPAMALVFATDFAALAFADIATIGIVLPGLVWLGARWDIGAARLGKVLGGLSFPLYCIHAPVVALCHGSAAAMAAACASLIGAAILIDRLYDQPIQAALKVRTQRPCPSSEALA